MALALIVLEIRLQLRLHRRFAEFQTYGKLHVHGDVALAVFVLAIELQERDTPEAETQVLIAALQTKPKAQMHYPVDV